MEGFESWRTGADGEAAAPTTIGQVPAATPAQAPVDPGAAPPTIIYQQSQPWTDWEPGPVQLTRTGAGFRWMVVLVLIALGVGVAALIRWIPTIAEDEAEKVVAEYELSLSDLSVTLPDVDAIVPGLTDLASDPGSTEALVATTRFQVAVSSLGQTVRAPLPSTPPLVPRDALDELLPLKRDISLVAGRGELIAARLNRLVAYRSLADTAFILPDLPNRGNLEETNDLAVAVASMLADSLETLSRLPQDALLDPHREEAQELFEFLKEWENRYLGALRTDDDVAASARTREARTRVQNWRDNLAGPLDELEVWFGTELNGLRADIRDSRLLLPTPSS